jgi:maltose/moltooligosaccharide transporter
MTAFIASIGFLFITKWCSSKWIHFIALALGGLGLMSVGWVSSESAWILKYISFVGVGIAWASILSMPYAMLSSVIPASRNGIYMGIFNLFIVIPEILFAIGVSKLMESVPSITRLQVVVFGGVCLMIASVATLLVSLESTSVQQGSTAS